MQLYYFRAVTMSQTLSFTANFKSFIKESTGHSAICRVLPASKEKDEEDRGKRRTILFAHSTFSTSIV